MKSAKPLIQLTAYYAILALGVTALIWAFPSLQSYFPLGGAQVLGSGLQEFLNGDANTNISWDPLEKSLRLIIVLVGALLLMEPVAWVYMGVRRRKGKEQSFVLSILLLPVVVAHPLPGEPPVHRNFFSVVQFPEDQHQVVKEHSNHQGDYQRLNARGKTRSDRDKNVDGIQRVIQG